MWDRGIWVDPSTSGYWDAQSKYSDTVVNHNTGGNGHVQASVCSLIFGRTTPAGVTDDVMVTSFAFAGPNTATATSVLLDADKATVEGYLNTWWGTVKLYIAPTITLKEYRWHDYLNVMGKPGPAVRITTRNVVATGTASTPPPDQVAMTQTFRTAARRHWGRVYLPKPSRDLLTAYGRLTTTEVDTLAAATRTMFNSAAGAAVPPYVVSHKFGALLTINQLAMDNTPDVIRRRRNKHPEYTKVYTS